MLVWVVAAVAAPVVVPTGTLALVAGGGVVPVVAGGAGDVAATLSATVGLFGGVLVPAVRGTLLGVHAVSSSAASVRHSVAAVVR